MLPTWQVVWPVQPEPPHWAYLSTWLCCGRAPDGICGKPLPSFCTSAVASASHMPSAQCGHSLLTRAAAARRLSNLKGCWASQEVTGRYQLESFKSNIAQSTQQLALSSCGYRPVQPTGTSCHLQQARQSPSGSSLGHRSTSRRCRRSTERLKTPHVCPLKALALMLGMVTSQPPQTLPHVSSDWPPWSPADTVPDALGPTALHLGFKADPALGALAATGLTWEGLYQRQHWCKALGWAFQPALKTSSQALLAPTWHSGTK